MHSPAREIFIGFTPTVLAGEVAETFAREGLLAGFVHLGVCLLLCEGCVQYIKANHS